jgi:hypothetical protein
VFKSYWALAWPTLVRNKLYTLVNVLGLALGICACLGIYLIAGYEFSFDTSHPDRDRIFCVINNRSKEEFDMWRSIGRIG